MTTDPCRSGTIPLIRTFLAIPLDNATLNTIESVQKQLQPNLPEIRWTRREHLHLTLLFFGDITEENLEKAGAIMVSVGSLYAPFSLTLESIGAFPSMQRARIIWLGVQSLRLGALYRSLQTRFLEAGFQLEHRPFRPHITIGRSRQQIGRILSQPSISVAGTMEVNELILFESRLQPAGAEHLPRHTARLAEPGRQEHELDGNSPAIDHRRE